MQAATIASTSPARETSAVKADALPPSDLMMLTVSSAAAPLRSTQNTCAPSRAKVTAVALPLPQPGPIDPAPTTIAVLPLSRFIAFSPLLLLAHTHGRDIGPDRMAHDFRQRPAFAVRAQPPFAGGRGIAERHFVHCEARRLPAKPAAG